MRKSRVSSHVSKTPRSTIKSASKSSIKESPSFLNSPSVERFIGISLGGGKADKACVSVVDYYKDQKRLFLSKVFERVKNENQISADAKIHEIIEQYQSELKVLAIDVPFKVPLCLRCELVCPGFENCKQEHIQWMWDQYRSISEKKKTKKIFTPYSQRAVEIYLSHQLEEPFQVPPAMGSNIGPLLARAQFLVRRWNASVIEVNPRVSVWRLGRALGMPRSQLRQHRHAVSGEDMRRVFLKSLIEEKNIFVYQQDYKLMCENNHAFESFVAALTALLFALGQTQPRPTNFPVEEDWVEFPQLQLNLNFGS